MGFVAPNASEGENTSRVSLNAHMYALFADDTCRTTSTLDNGVRLNPIEYVKLLASITF